MKRCCLLSVLLLSMPSLVNASIFKVWLVPGPADSSTYCYPVEVWGQVLPGPSNPDEDISTQGIYDAAVSIYTPGSIGATVPVAKGNSVSLTWGPEMDAFELKIPAAAQDGDRDSDLDAVEMAFSPGSFEVTTVGTTAPVLLATQQWKLLHGAPASLMPNIHPDSRHWNSDGVTRSRFEKLQVVPLTFMIPAISPKVNLSGPGRVNTSARGGSTLVGASFTVSKTSGDAPTSGTVDFGDGTAPAAATGAPFTTTHDYVITGDSQTFTATAAFSNDGGTGTASRELTVLRAPKIVLLVNGVVAAPGQVFDGPEFYGHNVVTLSLEASEGYIERFSMYNPWNNFNIISPTSLTWTGDSYNLYGDGMTFTVSNTGTGLNSDTLTVQFVPEPATLGWVVCGGLYLLRMRRRMANG